MLNPLNKRFKRDLKSDFGKYVAIFLFLVFFIGAVSGFFVADNSVIAMSDESFEKYNIEDGKFETEEKIYKKESTEFGKESEELESGNSDNPTLIAKESSFTDSTGKKRKGFIPPTLEEVQAYAKERGREDLAKKFFDYFEAGEWHDSEGKPVKAWKQKFITWEAHQPYADTIPRAGNGRPIKTVL